MARFKITTKQTKHFGSLRIERGMSVEVITQNNSNPVLTSQGQQLIADAFMRIYGIDARKACIINMANLDVKIM